MSLIDLKDPAPQSVKTNYGKACQKARWAIKETLFSMSQTMGCSPAEQSGYEFGKTPVTPEWLEKTKRFFKSLGYEFIIDETTMNDPAPVNVEKRNKKFAEIIERMHKVMQEDRSQGGNAKEKEYRDWHERVWQDRE
jgi:hypothetical protein